MEATQVEGMSRRERGSFLMGSEAFYPEKARSGASSSTASGSTPIRSHIPRRAIKGGSHLCAPNYCLRYRPARQYEAVDTSTGHIGLRCVVRG